MSQSDEIDIICPGCRARNRIEIYNSIEAEKDTHLVSKILNGTLFEFKCWGCSDTHVVEYPIEFRDQPNRIIVRCIPAAASPEPKVPGGLEADFRYFQVNSITGFCELIHIITDKLDPCAMLMLKHLIAAKFLEDHGNSPALLGYDCLGSYEGLDCLEYVVYNTEESSAESLTVPVKVYNELSAMTLPRLDTLFPKAVWSEWNERTAKDVWAKLD